MRDSAKPVPAPVLFNDLRISDPERRQEMDAAVQRVLDSGWFILGPELEAFETEFAAYQHRAIAVGVASGTDAIELALRAAGIGPGDEVITASHTAVPTVCAIERAGALPVLVDVDPLTGTVAPKAVAAAVTPRTTAILPVHLYGHPADMPALCQIAKQNRLLIIEDCAQAHGARINGQLVGTFGDLAAFSCYPTKNLGALGDAGVVVTDDYQWAERLRRLRNYGQSSRYVCEQRGVNSRLDELQAALLRVQLRRLDTDNRARRSLAEEYRRSLQGVVLPAEGFPDAEVQHVYHLFVVQHPLRDRLRERLEQLGVMTQIHYPVPVHLQPAYADLGYVRGDLPVTEKLCDRILSLPLYPGMSLETLDRVVAAIGRSMREAA